VKYIVVITQIARDVPHVNAATNDFHSGTLTAEARVYAYPSAEYLGSVAFTARSSEKIDYTEDPETKSLDPLLAYDLQTNAGKALVAAFAAGGKLPASSNAPAGKGPSFTLPAGWKPHELKGNQVFAAEAGTGDSYESLVVYKEPDATKFAADADCAALAAAYARDVKATVKTSALDGGGCVASFDWAGKRTGRLRYWKDAGGTYSIMCAAPSTSAGFAEHCDAVWASRVAG
jgi:hypothetical protein